MHVKLVRIGNSQGVRLPKAVIDQVRLGQDLDLQVSGGAIIIRPTRRVREGWAEAAAECRKANDDRAASEWDSTIGDFEGEWK